MKSFTQYITPSTQEVSLFKWIPIEDLQKFREKYGTSFLIRFRGPRYDAMRLTTLKKDAVAFSAYLKFRSKPYEDYSSEEVSL